MIWSGILSMVLGVILYCYGYALNNDLEAQVESIFNDGVSNPGTPFTNLGAVLFIVGIVLLIAGIIRDKNRLDERLEINRPQVNHVVTAYQKTEQLLCAKCGVVMPTGSKFCMNCGATVADMEADMFCPYCGKKIPKESKFCIECGREIKIIDKINAALSEQNTQ